MLLTFITTNAHSVTAEHHYAVYTFSSAINIYKAVSPVCIAKTIDVAISRLDLCSCVASGAFCLHSQRNRDEVPQNGGRGPCSSYSIANISSVETVVRGCRSRHQL